MKINWRLVAVIGLIGAVLQYVSIISGAWIAFPLSMAIAFTIYIMIWWAV